MYKLIPTNIYGKQGRTWSRENHLIKALLIYIRNVKQNAISIWSKRWPKYIDHTVSLWFLAFLLLQDKNVWNCLFHAGNQRKINLLKDQDRTFFTDNKNGRTKLELLLSNLKEAKRNKHLHAKTDIKWSLWKRKIKCLSTSIDSTTTTREKSGHETSFSSNIAHACIYDIYRYLRKKMFLSRKGKLIKIKVKKVRTYIIIFVIYLNSTVHAAGDSDWNHPAYVPYTVVLLDLLKKIKEKNFVFVFL